MNTELDFNECVNSLKQLCEDCKISQSTLNKEIDNAADILASSVKEDDNIQAKISFLLTIVDYYDLEQQLMDVAFGTEDDLDPDGPAT